MKYFNNKNIKLFYFNEIYNKLFPNDLKNLIYSYLPHKLSIIIKNSTPKYKIIAKTSFTCGGTSINYMSFLYINHKLYSYSVSLGECDTFNSMLCGHKFIMDNYKFKNNSKYISTYLDSENGKVKIYSYINNYTSDDDLGSTYFDEFLSNNNNINVTDYKNNYTYQLLIKIMSRKMCIYEYLESINFKYETFK
jgi:hypothetical protein